MTDAILKLRGLGAYLWKDQHPDAYVREIRSGWEELPGVVSHATQANLDTLWDRILRHEGETFRTIRGRAVTYRAKPGGLYFYHADGRPIDQFSSRNEIFEAAGRFPLRNTAGIKDLRNPSYLFAVLMDRRIHEGVL
jgi:hypothetical protein